MLRSAIPAVRSCYSSERSRVLKGPLAKSWSEASISRCTSPTPSQFASLAKHRKLHAASSLASPFCGAGSRNNTGELFVPSNHEFTNHSIHPMQASIKTRGLHAPTLKALPKSASVGSGQRPQKRKKKRTKRPKKKSLNVHDQSTPRRTHGETGRLIMTENPDSAEARKRLENERFKSRVRRAQMMLEALDASRPKFETEAGANKGWVTTFTARCRGVRVAASNETEPGRSKAEAEGLALIRSTREGGPLERLAGREAMDRIRGLMDESPNGHVAALRVPEFSEEALEDLTAVMGSREEGETRRAEHAERKARYEREFFERRRRKGRGRLVPTYNDASDSSDLEVEKNEMFVREEQARVEKAMTDPEGKQGKMQSIRDALPIIAIRDDLIEALKSQQVVVVSGGTGSGKSTQCPQYILEAAIANKCGSKTRIVVTQPRRIAAISVAERIADERDESIGNSVGYAVRFNKKSPREVGASIEFVTTGVLLRRLVNDPSLDGVSHVMIDEVHERDIDTDFLLVLLRDLLKKRPDFRVILMSATLDADSFGEYFSSVSGSTPIPVMSVPTKPRHPVEVIHLEDMAMEGASSMTFDNDIQSEIKDLARSLLRLHDEQLRLELEEAVAEDAAALKLEARSLKEDDGKISSDDEESSESESDSDNDTDTSYHSSASTRLKALHQAASMRGISRSKPNQSLYAIEQSEMREIGEISTKLLAMLAQNIAKAETNAGRKGSILCFLPGLDEIKEAMLILENETHPSLKHKMNILPLHSTIPQDEQQKVFIPAADGFVKVILATNIAESSVTIDDVLAVVDGGLVRELSWSAENAMSEMQTVPVSKASATQRLGRAGRVAPGKCYRIYSRGQHMAMLERPMPEIQRTDLAATCLNTCTLTNDSVETFLSRAMDPPKAEDVSHSMQRLRKLGAIKAQGGSESLTPLGQCLSRLPLDPAVGRMLIMGTVMQCLDPVLTAAACSSSRNLFFAPLGQRDEQRKRRQSFSRHSDLMAEVEAYHDFQQILAEDGWPAAREFAADNFLSIHAINSVHSVRSQLINELQTIGLVRPVDLVRSHGRHKELHPNAPVNTNSENKALYTAVWASGSPDNLAARRQLGNFGTLRTRAENHAGLHPSSVAFHRKPAKGTILPPWFSYREMVLSSQVFLRGCTAMNPEQILLFGGYALEDKNGGGAGMAQKVLDDWIIVESRCNDTLEILTRARSEVDIALDLKVMHPKRALPELQQAILDALANSINTGFDFMNEQ